MLAFEIQDNDDRTMDEVVADLKEMGYNKVTGKVIRGRVMLIAHK